jgi:hypothetical protein
MAKGQKKSTREPRKPKQAKPGKSKAGATPRSFLETIDRSVSDRSPGKSPAGHTGARR